LLRESIVRKKSFAFALKIIEFYKILKISRKEFVLATQLLKSGTSIGANVEEALGSQSQRDFLAKISISYKEARETRYWLSLLLESDYLPEQDAKKVMEDCNELIKILGSIQKTIREQFNS